MFNSVSCFAAAGIVAMLGPGSHQHENKSGRKVGDNHMGLNEITPYLVWIQRVKVGVGVLWYSITVLRSTVLVQVPPPLLWFSRTWLGKRQTCAKAAVKTERKLFRTNTSVGVMALSPI